MSLRTLKQKSEFWKIFKLNFFFHIYKLNWEVLLIQIPQKPIQNHKKLKTSQHITKQLLINKIIYSFFPNLFR